MDILSECRELSSKLIALRRELHRIPECGKELPKTRAFVERELDKLGIPYRESSCDSGIIAEIKGELSGGTVVFRADMDALNILEKTGVCYASEHEGQMHACGHDAHMAILLCAAEVINRCKPELHGTVRLVFQAAEEIGQGALDMISEGALEGVSRAYALHVGNLAGDSFEAGSIVIAPGAVTAGKKKFTITVNGVSAHSAFPHKGIDAIAVAARIVSACDEILSREVPSGKVAILTFGSISGGKDHNTITDRVEIKGSIRVQDAALREFVAERMTQICRSTAEAFRAGCEVDIKDGSPSVFNEPVASKAAYEAVHGAVGEGVYDSGRDAFLASDDFARYSESVPSVYFMLCTNNREKGIDSPNHNEKFNVDEDVLYRGAAAFAAIALDGEH